MNIILLSDHEFITADSAVIHNQSTIVHLKTVLNAHHGDFIKLGKLGGDMGHGRIAHMDENQVVLSEITLTKSPPCKLNLVVILALPRPKVLRRLVMDMTAAGVRHMVFINSYRTDKSYWSSPLLSRLDEFVIEGLQQGIDTIPPQITLAKRFKPFVQDDLPSLIGDGGAIVAHPYAEEYFGKLTQNQLPQVLVVGAEGGFIPYEIQLLGSVGVQAASLGKRILRTEAAVNALLGRWL